MLGGCFKRCVSSGAPQLLGRKHGSSALVREHPVLRGGGGCACMPPHGDVCRMAGSTGPRAWLDLWLGLVISWRVRCGPAVLVCCVPALGCASWLVFHAHWHATPQHQRLGVHTSRNALCGAANAAVKSGVPPKAVAYWLFGSAGMVFGMVVVGGYTRLSRAGAHMTLLHLVRAACHHLAPIL